LGPFSARQQAKEVNVRSLKLSVVLIFFFIFPTPLVAGIITVGTIQLQGKAVLGGTVIPYKEVTLSAQVPGRVEYIAGDVGDFFDVGTTVIAINDDDLRAKRNAVLAQLANADAALRNSFAQYGHELYYPQNRNLRSATDIGMGIPSMFDQMFTRNMGNFMGYGNPRADRWTDLYRQSTGVTQAQAAVMQARSSLDEINAEIRDARSVAPFEGVILSKMVEVGDAVQPGQPMLTFGHVKYLRIQAEVPASLVKYLQIGMFVPAYLDTARTRVDARVAQIYPLANPTQHTVTVKFDLPKSVPGGPGMYAEVMVPDGQVPEESTIIIPTSAVIQAGSLPGVLVVTDTNTSELRLIRLGPKVGADYVTVLSGLRAGERIIDNPPPGASSGWMPSSPKDK
jgi:multidrug efflux pump subunit AcrA (membrane-fusion protein)